MSSSKECQCCADTTSRIIPCPYCSYEACLRCQTTFITGQITEPSCMSCKKTYTFEFITSKFSATFVDKDYPAWRKKIMFETEKALLPQTMVYIEDVKKIPEMEQELIEIRALIDQLTEKKRELDRNLSIAKNIRAGVTPVQNVEKEEEVLKRVAVACPKSDCRGFLNHFYRCGLCSVQCCKECREINDTGDDHKCDPNVLETVKLLQKECRNCPACSIPIFKIEGCDQMWCVKCHTAFSWATGKLEKGVIHNPHYYKYMRENGGLARVDGGIDCGDQNYLRNMSNRVITMLSRYPRNSFSNILDGIGSWLRNIGSVVYDRNDIISYIQTISGIPQHIQYSYIQDLPSPHDNSSNLDLRIKFLMKEIDEDQFKSSLLRRKKKNQKLLEYREVLETYKQLVTEYIVQLFTNLLNDMKKGVNEILTEFVGEMERIVNFTNDAIDRVNKLHGGRKLSYISVKDVKEI